MKLLPILFIGFAALMHAGEIDWQRAKEIHQRAESGGKLSAEERKYLDEAMRQRASGGATAQAGEKKEDTFDWQKARMIFEKKRRGEKLGAEEESILNEAMKRRGAGERPAPQSLRLATPPPPPKDLVPLTELAGDYKGQTGGLYGGGKNEPSAEHAALARKAIGEIRPLDKDGKPAADGKIVFMSIGMSNTTQEFSEFLPLANASDSKAARVVVVDGAQGGKDATAWATADAMPWAVATQRLRTNEVSPQQVQAVWIKQALMGPQTGFPAEAERLRDRTREIVILAKQKYPNLRVAYLSSRIYAGYAKSKLNPEPYAFESAFAVRWLIEEQMKGGLNADAAKGEVKAPVLLWGPYLWANGQTPRKADGLTFAEDEMAADGTHPGIPARKKIAKLLLDFFTTNALAKPWFVK